MKAILFNKTVANALNQKLVINLVDHYKADKNFALISQIENPMFTSNYMDQLKERNVELLEHLQFYEKAFFKDTLSDCAPIDIELLNKLSIYEEMIFAQLIRNGYEYVNYSVIVSRYYQLLRFWNDFLDKNEIELFVLFDTPHSAYDYIIYCLCKIKGIKTVMGFQSNVCGYSYYLLDIEDAGYNMPLEIKKATELAKEKGDIELPLDYQAIIDKYERKTDIIPYYMKYKKPSIFQRIITNIKKTKKLSRLTGDSFLKTVLIKKKNYKARIGNYKQIRKVYDKLAVEPNFDEKFILFALHYQPENTSNPMGGRFEYQYLAIDMIAKHLPDGYYLYIKEHPNQEGIHFRYKEVFERLASNPKIKLIKMSTPTTELVEKCMAVATITGTIAFEAFFYKKPSLMFGDVAHKYAKGAYRIYNNEDCKKAISEIINGVEITTLDNKIFLKALSEISVKGGFADSFLIASGITDLNEIIENLTNGYIKAIENSFKNNCK